MFHGGHRIPAESFDILIQFLVGVFQEMFHVSRQVAVPFPQGRHSQHEFIKSVVQVFPKPSGRNGRFEIFVGGNDDAYVDSDIVGCADRAYLTLLQGAQQLYLYGKYPLIPTLWMIFEDPTFAFRSGDKHRSRRIYGK